MFMFLTLRTPAPSAVGFLRKKSAPPEGEALATVNPLLSLNLALRLGS